MTPRISYLADHPEHLATLARWHHEQWAHYHPGDTVGTRMARMRSHLDRRQVPTTFVATLGETLLGSASLVGSDMDSRTEFTPWLASVYVAREFRRRGVGSALVGRVEEEARDLGFTVLYLFTPDQERLYARLGWSVFERTHYRGEDVVIMSKDLTRPAADRSRP